MIESVMSNQLIFDCLYSLITSRVNIKNDGLDMVPLAIPEDQKITEGMNKKDMMANTLIRGINLPNSMVTYIYAKKLMKDK